jgi:hypothetical protein
MVILLESCNIPVEATVEVPPILTVAAVPEAELLAIVGEAPSVIVMPLVTVSVIPASIFKAGELLVPKVTLL